MIKRALKTLSYLYSVGWRFLFFAFFSFIIFTFFQVSYYRFAPIPYSHMMIYQHGPKYLFTGATIDYEWVSWNQMSLHMPLACMAAEDQTFLTHRGFDIKAMEKAWEQNKKGKKVKGASTLTQQVVKNLFLWPKRSYLRKGLEAYYTVIVELIWNKKRILEVYVNIAQMGPDLYGVGAASAKYFKKKPHQLYAYETASLAAVLPSPVRYSVLQPGSYIIRRREWIQRQMWQLGGVDLMKKL
jgi:monofunctional glycosyltransferase